MTDPDEAAVVRVLKPCFAAKKCVARIKSIAALGLHLCVSLVCSRGLEDFFAPLVAKACLQVKAPGANTFNVDSVRVNKIVGGDFKMSTLVNGMVIPRGALGKFTFPARVDLPRLPTLD